MIRPATLADADEIHALVCELADYEKLRLSVRSSPADFRSALFGDSPLAEALVVEVPEPESCDAPYRLAGMAIYFPSFSTFAGRRGLWLEDLYVRPEFRGQGFGKALLERFLSIAQEQNCARAEWSVLDWNTPAIEFYQHLGATVMPDWRIARVEL